MNLSMKYLFTNIVGSFVLNTNLDIIDEFRFNSIYEYLTKPKLNKKYPDLTELPLEKLPKVLALLKDKKYYSSFYKQNLALTRQAVKDSVSEDWLIIQAIANINELDKAANLLVKRLREWYSLYLPELSQKITSNEKFAELVSTKAKTELLKSLNVSDSMGADLEKSHVNEIIELSSRINELYSLRKTHEEYLHTVMKKHCPNLLELAGVTVGAKLLEIGKGLKNLALLPASTIQLLGAEKALFRHIKTGSRSPKHGIIINHPIIQKAKRDEKGKAARMLADKLSLCARLDYFKGEFKAAEYKKELEKKFL